MSYQHAPVSETATSVATPDRAAVPCDGSSAPDPARAASHGHALAQLSNAASGGAPMQLGRTRSQNLTALNAARNKLAKKPGLRKRVDRLIDSHKSAKGRRLPVSASRARWLRRWQRANARSKRNIAATRFKGRSGSRTVLAQSMGLGNKQLTLANETETTKTGELVKRSHSEAMLSATRSAQKLAVAGKQINVPNSQSKYHISSNEMCRNAKGQQNCSGRFGKELTPMYFVNPYSGSQSAGGFNQLVKDHDWAKHNVSGYDSESDSDDDEAMQIDDTALRGKTKVGIKPLKAFKFS